MFEKKHYKIIIFSEIQISLSLKKVLLEHRCFHATRATGTIRPTKPNSYSGFLQEKGAKCLL